MGQLTSCRYGSAWDFVSRENRIIKGGEMVGEKIGRYLSLLLLGSNKLLIKH
jgi:hypothetical protein